MIYKRLAYFGCLTLLTLALLQGSRMTADEWPQWRGPNRDGVWSETGIVDSFDSPQIKLRWRVAIAGGYSGPTVAHGRVYVTDRVVEPKQIERVHCFDWETGRQVWSHEYHCQYTGISYDAGPRASVLLNEGRAYSLGSAGHLFCFDAAKGTVLWKKDLRTQYKIRMPNWGIAASPIVEGDLIIVQIGGEDACLVAFDKKTGDERWKGLADEASYSAPIVIEQAGQRVLVCWTGDRIVGVDPQTGTLQWKFPSPHRQWPIAIATPVLHGDLLFLSEAHKGSLLLKLRRDDLQVDEVWHREKAKGDDTPALHCLISTPYIEDGYIYAADNRGVLRCLNLDSGEQIWEDTSACPEDRFATIHLVRNGDRTWLFNERGELILGKLSPDGFDEISRTKLVAPTTDQYRRRGGVTWSHPAFAYRHVFARNDKELVCADLSAKMASD